MVIFPMIKFQSSIIYDLDYIPLRSDRVALYLHHIIFKLYFTITMIQEVFSH